MFNRVTLVQRISAGFLLVIVLLAMIVWSGNSALEDNQQALQRVVNSEAEKVRLVGRMGQHLLALQRAEKNLILARTQQQMDGYQAAIEQQDRELKERLSRVRQLVDRQGEGLLNLFAEQYEEFRTNQRAVVGLSRQNANVRARELSQGEGRAAYDSASVAMAKLVELNDRGVGRLQRAVAESVSTLKLSAQLLQDLLTISRAERNMMLASNAGELDEQSLLITQRQVEMQGRRTRLRALVDDQGAQILDAFVVEWEQFLALNRQLRGLLQQRASAPGESEALSADPYALAAVQGRAHSERAEQLLIRLMNKSDQEHGAQLRDLGRASEKIKLAARINRNLTELQRGEKSVILATTEQEMDEYAHALADLRLDLEGRLRELGQLIAAQEEGELSAAAGSTLGMERAAYDGFSRAYQGYLQIHQQVRETSRLNSNVKALARSNGEGRASFDRAEATLNQLVLRADAEMDAALLQSESNFIAARNTAYVIAAMALLIALMVALLIVRILSSRTQQLAERAQQIALGDLQGGQRSEVEDELSVVERTLEQIQDSFAEVVKIANGIAVGDLQGRLTPRSAQDPLVESINRMADNSEETIRIANVIAGGDLDAEITLLSEQDQLGHALQKMVFNLQQSRQEMARRNWIDEGVAAINETVRGEQSVQQLASTTIERLCHYLGAQVGALYLRRDEDGNGNPLSDPELVLIGSYAYTERKNLANRYRWGESLVGQAALEGQPILLSNVPDDYIKVTSGLGESTPHHILVHPFLLDQRVMGVVELGTLEALTTEAQELLARAAEAIAIAFNTAHARSALDRALKESQSFAEELQVQQEELQETNEQLEEQTQALEVSQSEVEERNRDLEAAQKELNERAEQLAQSSRYKSEFLANMSHELRTPLNSILLLSKMLACGDADSEEEQRQNAQVIHDAGSDLLGLINEVLDLSKIESGKMTVHLSTIALEEFVNSFNPLFRPQAEERGIDFEVVVEPGLPQSFRSDRDRLTQVMRNFLSNAMKFTQQGGVTVRASKVDESLISSLVTFSNLREVLRADPEQYLVLQVEDTGIGIPDEKRQLVFEAFQQADGTTSRTFGGTGLGLSISRQIADMLEGALALRSSIDPQGHGSTFSIVIPRAPSATLNAVAASFGELEQQLSLPQSTVDALPTTLGQQVSDDQRITSPRDERILLVIEDDPHFAQTLVELGRRHAFKVVHASTGTEGVRLAEYYLPSAILLDIQLPILDGWGVLRHLKKTAATSHIPVHVVSVMDEQQFGYRLGAAQYLVKPVEPRQLESAFQTIEEHLSRGVRHLLVVEDNEIERESIIQLLGCGQDLQCEGVSSGGAALEALRSNHYDAFILDLRLPDMSGFEVLKRVAEDPAIERVPTIVYTGQDLSLQEEKQLREYAESIVLKTAESPARLLEESAIFLHRVRSNLSEESQRMLSEVVHADQQFQGRTILLVDDDIRNTFAISSMLEKRGLKVVTAADGQEALEQLHRHADEIDMVLMDIMMPVMDGYEATRKIREEQRFERLPVIALTAKALKEDRDLCIEAGASDYMTKPIDYDQLFSLIRVWLSTLNRL